MEKHQQQKHDEAYQVLVLPYPIQGHINPMLQFSKRLASKGLKVTLITTSKSMQPSASSIHFHSIDFQEAETTTGIDEHIRLYESLIPARLAQFIEKHQIYSQHRAKVLVYDSCMPWALDVAKRLGLQGASFFTQCWAVNAIFYHLKLGTLKVPSEEQIRTNAVVSLPSMPELEISDLPSAAYDNSGSYPGLWNLIRRQFSNFQEADWTFCNTYDKLEHQIINWMASKWPIKTIGPTVPSMYLDKRLQDDDDYGLHLFKLHTDLCIEWLNSKETGSVIYVAFGSIAGLTEKQMGELTMGLKSTKKHFLWVVRETEQNKLPSNFIEETSEKGLVSWSPQLDVLSHRAVGCFMTHCGWNSTLEALSIGVPMIAMPQWTDQMTNAKFVVDVWEVGIRVKKDGNGIITKEEIQRCVREVMEGERSLDIKRNSEKWRKLAIDAVDDGGSSDKNIEEFVAKITCN
ncbi:UDP-glycosyltransferase 74E1 [Hibiscus syriacus]|uniref:UDP-glycosyltransferase 74E1 n=1 Tax=Hibiscus syriacus TaxID=106335 RepID=A0A6A3BNV1_HIBSY|nr:UDP-glycosyltransferase 74E2-like [Hibiscus syriacus]KAE8718293.1 UDP-glycosyltransferase 74E1 [Hibiscus syriacus]